MDPNAILSIIELAAGIAKANTSGAVAQDFAIGAALVEIIQKAVQAYEDHVGSPIDISLIQPETHI